MRSNPTEDQVTDRWRRNDLPRWYSTLAFRLTALINVAAAGVLALFWCVDYARERSVHVREAAERLAEEAKVLRITRAILADAPRFQAYLDDFCHQMDLHSSPGHHIIIADSTRNIAARAHVRADPSLESEMLAATRKDLERFRHNGDEFVVSALHDSDGKVIVVAQSLAPAYAIIRAQAVSRAISLAVLGAAMGLISTLAIWRWVRRPIHTLVNHMHTVQCGVLTCRAEASGPPEVRLLASGFNTMTESLDRNERTRIQELERARQIQRRLLPGEDAKIPGARIAFQYEPADAVGGDYVDVFQCSDNRWLIVMADVCGHGVAAALLATLLKTHTRHHAINHGQPSEIMAAVNKELCPILTDGQFVTCTIIRYDPEHGSLEYANAGHPPALIADRQGQVVARFKCTSSVLGVWPTTTIGAGQAILNRGDRLIAYTDGLVECLNSSEELFGSERLACFLSQTTGLDPEGQAAQLLREAHLFAGNRRLTDDVTILILQRMEHP